jgi:hypothetical protein
VYQIGRKNGQPVEITFRPVVFDSDVLPRDIAGIGQALAKCGFEERVHSGFADIQKAD